MKVEKTARRSIRQIIQCLHLLLLCKSDLTTFAVLQEIIAEGRDGMTDTELETLIQRLTDVPNEGFPTVW